MTHARRPGPSKASKPRPRTPARAEAARHNGAKGGRPRSRLPEDVIATIGAPPMDPADALGRTRWASLLVTQVAWLEANGLIGADLADRLCKRAAVAARVFPTDLVLAVESKLRKEQETTVVSEAGPALEEIGRVDQSKPTVRRKAR